MAKKKTSKRVVKEAAKAAKKHPGVAIFLILLLVVCAVGGYFGYRYYRQQNPETTFVLNGPNVQNVPLNGRYIERGVTATYNGADVSGKTEITYYFGDAQTAVEGVDTSVPGNYRVHYEISYEKMKEHLSRSVSVRETETAMFSASCLDLGNQYTGDSVYIKAGDVDILIDAGSRSSSAKAIGDFLRKPGNVEDGKLEFVIATHAHKDHIAGFVGDNSNPGVFEQFQIDTLIDFPKTGKSTQVFQSYASKRETLVNNGTKHFTAKGCIDEALPGAKKVYPLGAGLSMEILNQKFYVEETSDENNYSVCTLFTHGENHYLFTGDLEKQGEASLVEMNQLPEVELFKGGHHGSYTANTDALLSVIKPKTVCICCCAGSTEYTKNPLNTFPAQDAITRIAKYTENVYVTSLVDETSEKGYQPFNGTITCSSVAGLAIDNLEIQCSHSNVILKDSEWFQSHRTWPSS